MSELTPITTESRAYELMQGKLGPEGMQMLDEQLTLWHELNNSELRSPLRDALSRGDTTLPAGTLLHGMGMHGFSTEALQGVAEKGIVSGELTGKVEDAETHGCADFFRVPANTDISGYMGYAKEKVTKGNIRTSRGESLLARGVTFIVDPSAEGMDHLLDKNGYTNPSMANFVRPPGDRTAEDTAAILGGVPRGAIAGIIVGDKLLAKDGVAATITETFPGLPVFNHEGVLQQQPGSLVEVA